MASEWLILTSTNNEKVFIKKADVIQVSTNKAHDRQYSCVTAKIRGRRKVIAVLEAAKEIMWRL